MKLKRTKCTPGKSPAGKPKIKILKANPVARGLAEPRFRPRVKPSGKRYRRAAQKRQLNAALSGGKEPMSSRVPTLVG